MQQQRGRSGVRSDISVCDCGVCSDHYDDNDDVGFNVAVITRSGITLFQTQETLIFAIQCGRLGNIASLFEYCSQFIYKHVEAWRSCCVSGCSPSHRLTVSQCNAFLFKRCF